MQDKISVLLSEEELQRRIVEMADRINEDYKGRSVHMIIILKGSIFFACELAKHITLPVTMDFMSVSSYGNSTSSSGTIEIKKDLDEPVEGEDLLVVEDIIDTGRTLGCLLKILRERKPASLRLITMLDKPDRRVDTSVEVDYTGFEIPDKFVVGFGLDYAQRYRNLPYIGVVEV